MSNPNPYLEYVTTTTTAPSASPAGDTTTDLAAMFAPKHVFTFGPLSIDCDLDPSDGEMGVTCTLLGFKFFEQKFTNKDGTVAADCARGPMRAHLQLTPNFSNHSIAYQIKLCMLTSCVDLAGNMGGFTPQTA